MKKQKNYRVKNVNRNFIVQKVYQNLKKMKLVIVRIKVHEIFQKEIVLNLLKIQ